MSRLRGEMLSKVGLLRYFETLAELNMLRGGFHLQYRAYNPKVRSQEITYMQFGTTWFAAFRITSSFPTRRPRAWLNSLLFHSVDK